MSYTEKIDSYQVEGIGQIDFIKSSDFDLQVWINKKQIHIPNHWIRLSHAKLINKIKVLIKSADKLGVKIGG